MNLSQDNNPNRRRPGTFVAHVGIFGWSYSSSLTDYQRGVEAIFQQFSLHSESSDCGAFPLLFLMRHTLELGHKFTLHHLYRWRGEIYDPIKDGHDLQPLHNKLRECFLKIAKEQGVDQEILEQFESYSKATMAIIDALAPIDFAGGQLMQYPFAKIKKEIVMIDGKQTVNLLDLKEKFDAGMTLLKCTADVIGDPPSSE